MALNPSSLSNIKVLSGALWLIGRSYAASPQRRSYGTSKTGEKYHGKDGKEKVRPVWPVLTDNDGREDFFSQIADTLLSNKFYTLIANTQKSKTFEYVRDSLFNNGPVNINSNDYKALKTCILSVLRFNLDLCVALETFDKVPSLNYIFKGESVICSNHISFCSKFLHFYFPNIVYIIDSFASVGADLLFDHKRTDTCFDHARDNFFDSSIYTSFNSVCYQTLLKAIMSDSDIKKILDTYSERKIAKAGISNKDEASLATEDTTGANDYVTHCVRSYMLGLFTTENGIVPINQLAAGTLNPVSRLVDAVFLNINKPLTKAELDYQKELLTIYGITI